MTAVPDSACSTRGLDGLVRLDAQNLLQAPADDVRFGVAEPALVLGAHEAIALAHVHVGDHDREGIRDDLQLPLALAKRLLRLPPFRDVTREAPRMNELSFARVHVGADEDVLDRAVLGHEASLVVMEFVAAAEARENIVNGRAVRVELSDVSTDVLRLGVSEQLELGAIGPENRSVRCHAV